MKKGWKSFLVAFKTKDFIIS